MVAITKCDLPGADPKRVRQQLLAEGLQLEEAGGDVQVPLLSACADSGFTAAHASICQGQRHQPLEKLQLPVRCFRALWPGSSNAWPGCRLWRRQRLSA